MTLSDQTGPQAVRGSDAVMPPWRDVTRSIEDRVDALMAEMTVREKVAQLYGVWVGASADGEDVAPHQHEMSEPIDLDALLPSGLGQLTRPFGTAPVDPALGALSLMRAQQRIAAANRFGIPAIAHEECLAGFATWGATAYPVPLSWGATFDPALIQEIGARIGADMRALGVHQGLAPVLDVVRDARWGRVEETIGEDPYLVGTVATAYIRGLESADVVATLKHFVGYSASRAGRNLAPVSVGPRELADVLLPPFEMAVRESGVRSVMNAYTDIDGVATAADPALLTRLLRDTWGFDGTVVADYFAIGFLTQLHGVAEDWVDAGRLALTAGIDVELPTVKALSEPFVAAVQEGRVDGALVDRASRRVLRQKAEFGMLDPEWSAAPDALLGVESDSPAALRGRVDLDSADNRALARRVAESAVVLLSNDGTLPLAPSRRIAVVGPTAEDPYAVLGCYSFPSHVGVHHPEVPIGIELSTLREAIAAEFPDADVTYEPGTTVDGGETDGFDAAVAAASVADIVVLALGDRAGLFGRGTSGEGCDAESLALPGAQGALLEAILAAGTPTVVTLLAGRPYALGTGVESAAAIIQTFFPGEEGTGAIAGVLSGRVNPSGRLPVSVPATPGAQPSTYLAAPLARRSGVSNIDPSPAFPFGHGIGYSSFVWSDAAASADAVGTDGRVTVSLRVGNAGDRDGTEVVQLYLRDPVASVVRPVQRLIAFARLDLAAGAAARVRFTVPADLASFTGVDGVRIVEPGEIVLGFGRSSGDIVQELSVRLSGPVRPVDHTRALHADVVVEEL
ncbi:MULTISPECIES: glycoside hydrolase family 3 N-terminal domain-containing protein [unclassified Microbacterium]|uniref:beta-xylosidase/alpha-l-arabinosidase n=1 Tax=unclassified Microbacterium TaxID=2609290 RepID=UPI00214A9C33|nr:MULTISPECIES: glycoside hydrolase family 3 N-terminal domain-containing protein [unclassified Microbacterium]MCR2808747.1 glycoside hydrolase family 3 C-terminal domain-containing protein [Microbacterium sp. zg.B185]WIM18825.1 glycoside hydrolase family 3 N-terminal domain-containing protein [Microbacterium sp. zg-B185]